MLSRTEYEGLKSILDDTDDDDLYAVLETVTKGTRTADARVDAVRQILANTDDPSDLLRRQKITKRVLINYLERQGISVSSSMGKQCLVDACLDIWHSQSSGTAIARCSKSPKYRKQPVSRKRPKFIQPSQGCAVTEFSESHKYHVRTVPYERPNYTTSAPLGVTFSAFQQSPYKVQAVPTILVAPRPKAVVKRTTEIYVCDYEQPGSSHYPYSSYSNL